MSKQTIKTRSQERLNSPDDSDKERKRFTGRCYLVFSNVKHWLEDSKYVYINSCKSIKMVLYDKVELHFRNGPLSHASLTLDKKKRNYVQMYI